MGKVLTVSVAGYNIERFIDTCLEPFADAEFCEKLEVVIIDDGSTDGTKDKAKNTVFTLMWKGGRLIPPHS